jgi:release factor glutamine methyltransferase
MAGSDGRAGASPEAARALAAEAAGRLADAGVADPPRDAELLLLHVTGLTRARLHADPEQLIEPAAAAVYRGLVTIRVARVPIQHLTGVQEFWSLPFEVTPDVLIPRPETEHLIEAFLAIPARPSSVVLDLGTGSGCLAVVAARERPGARVIATDVSRGALAVAARNAARHGVADRIRFVEGDLFAPLAALGIEGRVDALLSNPPYIPEADLAGLLPEVRDHEPRAALTPGPDGLLAHRRLARGAPAFLAPGGHAVVEIGQGQAAAARALYESAGLEVTAVRRDLAGIERILTARRR